MQGKNIPSIIYHGDWDLLRDSKSRKEWIWKSFSGNVPQYIDRINTLKWLNFPRAHNHLKTLLKNTPISIKSYYSRESGKINSWNISLKPKNGVILYENVILWVGNHLDKFDIIFFLGTPHSQCLIDAISCDSAKRNPVDVVCRFILTTHGANIFFRELFDNYSDKVIPIDRKWDIIPRPEIYNVDFFSCTS